MKNFTTVLAISCAALATGCGGTSGGSSIVGGAPVAAVATGTMTKGSVIVDGVHFTAANAATIRVDDNPGQTEDKLRSGMQVKVKGQINSDGVNGTFEKVEAEPEVRGKISSKGGNNFLVNNQSVIVEDDAVFEDRIGGSFNPLTLADLALGDTVEIHGVRDFLGRVRAARIERRHDSPSDEVKGTITTAPNGGTFQIANAGAGTVTVNFDAATALLPAGSTLNPGDPVEIHGVFNAGTITATRIDREDLEDAELEPAEGHKIHAEGQVSGFNGHPGNFKVNGREVQTTSATVFMSGAPADLDNGTRVEAEGHVSQGVMIAARIKFKRGMVRIQATVTAHTGSTLTLFGKTLPVDALLTRLNNVDLANIVDGATRVEIRGCVDSTGAIIPLRIDAAGGGNDFLQAPVSKMLASAKLLVLVSENNAVNADLAGVLESNFRDLNNASIGSAAFFAGVTQAASGVPGTAVKVKGAFNAANNTITATEAEIEK